MTTEMSTATKANHDNRELTRGEGLQPVSFLVYDVSDFEPRGSLRPVEEILPPFPLSTVTPELDSLFKIMRMIKEANPNADIDERIRRHAEFIAKLPSSLPESYDLRKRIEPEKIHRRLTLDFLKNNLFMYRNKQLFKKGEKIALLSIAGDDELLIVDINKGIYRTVSIYDFDEKSKSHIQRLGKSNNLDEQKTFVERDGSHEELKVAHDEGRRKKYAPDTENFFRRMLAADLEVENMLINKMELVTAVSELVLRLGKRLGRTKTREILEVLRKEDKEDIESHKHLLDEFCTDIEYAGRVDSKQVYISPEQLQEGFEVLFQVERSYLSAILDFPWNKVGPEPFDTLIEVLWFRSNLSVLRRTWGERDMIRKALTRETYKDAQIERILTWAHKTHGIIASSLKELKEMDISYEMDDVENIAGPLSLFIYKSKIDKRVGSDRPSYLTKLLWGTLKWASASEWKHAGDIMTSDFRYLDALIWEESIPDPEWVQLGDTQGRLRLSGETLNRPLGHVKSDKGGWYKQLGKEISFKFEEEGQEISLADITLERQRVLRSLKEPRAFESIVRNFEMVIRTLNIIELADKIETLEPNEKIVVWHRLGYSISAELSGLEFGGKKCGIDTWSPVIYIVKELFMSNPTRYYRTLREITTKLQLV